MFVTSHSSRRAFTLLEVLIVLAVLGVLAALLIPSTNPDAYARLEMAAAAVGRDIEYARSLAITHDDNYRIDFDLANNRWTLVHSGSNSALNTLPITPLHPATDSPDQQTTTLGELPGVGGTTRLHAVWALAVPPQTITDIEFEPLGETTRSEPTLVWLATGTGDSTRYLSVRINPVTGLYWIEGFRATEPSPATYTIP
ncbi:MAG: Tfp pilus assembly protein FimT/FimU [Pirellulales bacterium]